MTVVNGKLTTEISPPRARKYTLDELLNGMTKDNVPAEIDWCKPRGNEIW